MQLLPVYTGFVLQAVLGGLMQTTKKPCSQQQFNLHFYMKNGSSGTESMCKRMSGQMFCPPGNKNCIKDQFQVSFADRNVECTIREPRPKDLMVNCSSQSGSNQIACNGNSHRFQMPVDCVVEGNCSSKEINITCNTTLVPTSQTPETSTPSATTSAMTTVTSSSESTSTKDTTLSISADTSTVYRSNTLSLTHLTKTTSFDILASSSSEAVSEAFTATLVGGVVGGVLVGVVITVVVVVLWWKCRRRSEIQDDGKGESHVYLGLAPVGNSDHGAPTAVPDVIKMSQAARDTSPISDFRSENQGETSGQDACIQGDYTYIKEVELDEDGAYSLGKGFPNTVSSKDLAKSGIDSGSGQITDTYNRLGARAETSTPQTDTYNRIGGEGNDGKIIKDSDEMHPSSDYFVLESSPDQEDTYNRLTAGDEPRGQLNNSTYNRIGETDAEHRDGMDQELTSPDYHILEKADIPGTQDDYNRLGYVSSETSSSNLKNTYNRIGDISTEEERSGPSPDYFILEKNDGQGN